MSAAAAAVTARMVRVTELRQDIYNKLDEVIASGEPIAVERNGVTVTIATSPTRSKLDRLAKFQGEQIWEGDQNDIFRIDHMKAWREAWKID